MGIIADTGIRTRIAEYYKRYNDSHNRIEERETIYPALSYQLVPRGSTNREEAGIVWERDVESGLSDAALSQLAESVHGSAIGDHVTAEINLSRFMRGITLELQNEAASLKTLLKEYHVTIR